MKKIYLSFVLIFAFIICSAKVNDDMQAEAYKHDYNTLFAIKTEKTFNVFYKDDYGTVSEEFSVTPEKLLSIDTSINDSYKHEYNSFFVIDYTSVAGEAYSIFYKDDYGAVKFVYTAMSKPEKSKGYADGYKEGHEELENSNDKENEDDDDKKSGAGIFLFLIIAFFGWLLFFD